MDTVLTNKEIPPADEVLNELLKKSFVQFKKLRVLSSLFLQEWKYYNKKNGWVFKVSSKKRGLYYITPLANCFHVGLAVNEADKAAVLNSDVNDQIKKDLASVKKYMEGYPIRMTVKTKNDLDQLLLVLKTVNRI